MYIYRLFLANISDHISVITLYCWSVREIILNNTSGNQLNRLTERPDESEEILYSVWCNNGKH